MYVISNYSISISKNNKIKSIFSLNYFVILLKMIKFAPKSDKTQYEVSN